MKRDFRDCLADVLPAIEEMPPLRPRVEQMARETGQSAEQPS